MDFAVLADHRVKLKYSKKKTSILLGNWKNCDIKITFIPIIIGALGTVYKGLIKIPEDLEIRGRMKTIQTTAFWDRPEFWKRGNLRRLTVIQTPVKAPQLTLMWKIRKE